MSTVEVHADTDALADAIAARLTERLAQIQGEGRRPRLVLTGGTIAIATYERLGADTVDWRDVDYYWGDERYVPAGHDDRNDQQARDSFLDRLGVPAERVHAAPADDGTQDAAAAADAWAAELPAEPFDIVLLGVGPDGHVASLFPGFAQLRETARRAVAVRDSPKPPPTRLTLTFPTLNHADSVWFVVSGEGKADAVGRALGDGTLDDTPATGAHGQAETLWLLDRPAARDVAE
jgi:6-phosphogluconolactonase